MIGKTNMNFLIKEESAEADGVCFLLFPTTINRGVVLICND